MAKQLFANNATSMLSGILTQGGNVLVCIIGEGNRFPSPAADEYFLLTIYTKDAYANEQNVEVVKVTSRAGDTLMIERDVELLTGQSGGYAYNGNTEQVYLELRWTAAGAGNVLQASDNLASLANASQARTNLGLGNVDNTADVNKPISTATQAALNGKADTGHIHAQYADSADPRLSDARPASDVSAWAKAATKPSYTKTEVGLGNVDNTSDANKPISTATQTALDTKQATLVSGTNIKTINSTSILGNGNIVTGDVTVGGVQTLTNKIISGFHFIDKYVSIPAATGNPVNLDLALGSVFDATLAGNTTFAFTNAPTLSGEVLSFSLKVNQGSTAYAITWPVGITWLTTGGAVPSAPAANKSTEYIFSMIAGGSYLGRKGAST